MMQACIFVLMAVALTTEKETNTTTSQQPNITTTTSQQPNMATTSQPTSKLLITAKPTSTATPLGLPARPKASESLGDEEKETNTTTSQQPNITTTTSQQPNMATTSQPTSKLLITAKPTSTATPLGLPARPKPSKSLGDSSSGPLIAVPIILGVAAVAALAMWAVHIRRKPKHSENQTQAEVLPRSLPMVPQEGSQLTVKGPGSDVRSASSKASSLASKESPTASSAASSEASLHVDFGRLQVGPYINEWEFPVEATATPGDDSSEGTGTEGSAAGSEM